MLKRLFIMASLAFISASSFADWEYVASYNERAVGMDRNKIRPVTEYSYKNYKQAWSKWVITNDLTKDGMTVGDYSLQLMWYDCDGRKSGLKSYTDYKANGTTIPKNSFSTIYPNMTDVVPDSVGEALLDFVCNN